MGPKTFVRRDYEVVTFGPQKMIQLPPKTYVKINNPIVMEKGAPVKHSSGLFKLRHGETEIRTAEDYTDPFPLYPGEENLNPSPLKFKVINKDQAIKIRINRTYELGGKTYPAGYVYQIYGPKTYIPRKEEDFVEEISKVVVKKNQAVKLLALRDFTDRSGVARKTGEEWNYDQEGSFIPDCYEKIVSVQTGHVLTDKKAVHMRAVRDFTDKFGTKRQAGEQWLVTNDQTQTYLPSVCEVMVKNVEATTLSNREYCIIENPYDKKTGRVRRGEREIRIGEATFFIQPGEIKVQSEKVKVLSNDEAILLVANKTFQDEENKCERKAGDRWLIRGPREFVPNVETVILEVRKDIVLDSSEGVYIRDLNTGGVRAVCGETVMLKAHEELWSKKLNPEMSAMLNRRYDIDDTRVVTYPASDNSAVMIFDYLSGKNRVVFGPELIMLQPNEQIKVMDISGGTPKVENQEKLVAVPLGQNTFEDEIIIETQDHAALIAKLSYCAHFRITDDIRKNPTKLFQINDFIGITCKTVASRIRGAVSKIPYNEFHHNYSTIVHKAVFGASSEYIQSENNFVLTSCDVKSLEPYEVEIREKLKKNTAQAIDLKTKGSELEYLLKQKILEEDSRGQLEIQRLVNETMAAEKRVDLDKLTVESEAIMKVGEQVSKAKAEAEGMKIKGNGELKQSEWSANSYGVETETLIKSMELENKKEENKKQQEDNMEIDTSRKIADIEITKFKSLLAAIGTDTIIAMAKSGPENKARMLKSLGLGGYLVTDGKTPINLFGAAEGLIAPQGN